MQNLAYTVQQEQHKHKMSAQNHNNQRFKDFHTKKIQLNIQQLVFFHTF